MGDSDLFSGFRYWFYHLGLWSPKPTRIYRIYNYLVLTTFSFFILGFALVISDAARIGLEVFGVNFGVLLTMTITMLKMVNSSRQKYQTILNHVFQQHEYICSKNDFKYIFFEATKIPARICKIYRMSMVIPMVSIPMVSIFFIIKFNSYCFEDYCPRPFPFIYWTPFDQRKYYMMANFYQDFHAAIVAILIIYTDFVVLAPVFFLIAKIKVLQYVLEHPTEFFKKELTYEENFYYVARECVVEYQDIIKAHENYNSAMNHINLCDFFFHSAQIAGCLISVLLSESLAKVENITYVFVGGTVFFQLYIIYWHGQILIDESQNISTHIYQSEWYKSNVKTRRLLIMMMIRSRKPLALKVGGIFVMDLSVFLKLLKGVYSIMMVFLKRES